MTKKSKKTTTKQPEPAKTQEPAAAPSGSPAESNKAGLGPILRAKVTILEKDAKDLLPRVIKLEKQAKDIGSGQTEMIEQYDAFTKTVDERILEVSKNVAFGEGMRFVIIMAETNLAKALKLPDRNALSNDGRNLPSWWLATLMQLYDYLPAKPIEPVKPAVVAFIAGKKEAIRETEEVG